MPRYIDADALFEYIQKEKAWKQDTIRRPRYDQGKYDAFYEMLEIIRQQPTAPVEPVVHCSECESKEDNGKFYYCYYLHAYVPKSFGCICGKRKDGEK